MFCSDARAGSEEARDISVDDSAQPQSSVPGGNDKRARAYGNSQESCKG